MECILHIGTEKTGTTAIQKMLYANRETFLKNGVYLTKTLETPNNNAVAARTSNDYDEFFKRKGLRSEDISKYINSIDENFSKEMAQAKRYSKTILTSEHFHSRLQSLEEILSLKNYLEPHFKNIKVVCYFREQSSLALSAYSTALKHGATIRLEHFLNGVTPDNYYYNHFKIAKNWTSAFGRENFIHGIYEKKNLYINDIRRDFLQKCNLSNLQQQLKLENKNENGSLSLLQAILLRQLNERVPPYIEELGTYSKDAERKRQIIVNDKNLQIGNLYHEGLHQISARFDETNSQLLSFLGSDNAFNSIDEHKKGIHFRQVDEIVSKLYEQYEAELVALRKIASDHSARRSNIAELIDYIDYKTHFFLSKFPVSSNTFRERFAQAAHRRRRQKYFVKGK